MRGFLAGLLIAGASHAEVDGAKVFTAPLGPNGAPYRVSTVNVATTDLGDYFQLVVSDGSGRRVWAGPRAPDEKDPLVFGSWHFGVSLPECVADVDGDGAIELMAPEPQSDVSPTGWRVLRWSGAAFAPVRTGTLVESPKGSGRYPWGKLDTIPARWVSAFESAKDGAVTAEISEYEETQVRQRRAQLAAQPEGYRLVRWLEPLAPPKAGETVRYICEIGPEDLKSSSGKLLTKVLEVLRQDRANVHRFGKRHPGDGVDPYFADAKHREAMDRLKLECAPELATRILSGSARLDVAVFTDRVGVGPAR